MLFALAIGVIMTLLCYLFTGSMVQVFLENPEAYDYGVRFARILLSILLVAVLYVYTIRRMESKTKGSSVEASQNA